MLYITLGSSFQFLFKLSSKTKNPHNTNLIVRDLTGKALTIREHVFSPIYLILNTGTPNTPCHMTWWIIYVC